MRRNLQLNPFKKKSNAKPNKAHKLFILLPFISLLGLTLPSCGKNDNPSNPSGTKAAETSNPATPQSNIPPSQASAQAHGTAGIVPISENACTPKDRVKIVTIDEFDLTEISPDRSLHFDEMWVTPGQIITLTADITRGMEANALANAAASTFIWHANDSTNDVCNVAQPETCSKSNFTVTDTGVTFTVPKAMKENLLISVKDGLPGDISVGFRLVDRLTLWKKNERSLSHSDSWPFKKRVRKSSGNSCRKCPSTSSPGEVHGDIHAGAQIKVNVQIDVRAELANQGHWVIVGSTNFWVPPAPAGWMPYRNGYWQNRGTWISYDAWGRVTDHYGVWRHHRVYGWIWMPFPSPVYHASVVTWVYQGPYVGWYPYSQSYTYLGGEELGFDDGYWLGLQASAGYGGQGYYYVPGFTFIPQVNISANYYGPYLVPSPFIFFGTGSSSGYRRPPVF